MTLGGEGLGWAVAVGAPEPEVGQDLLDCLAFLDENDNPHRAATLHTLHGVGLVHLFDEVGPASIAE